MRFGFALIVMFLFLTGFSQTKQSAPEINSFELTNNITYLPSVHGECESYRYNSGRLRHKYSETKHFWRFHWNSHKLITSSSKEQLLKSVDYIIQNKNNTSFSIGLSSQDKDSLISMSKMKDYKGFPLYSIDYSDLIKYINSKDTIKIDIKEFNFPSSIIQDALSSVIDGAPFWITLKLRFTSNDTLKYEYIGNLNDGINDTSVDEFLIFYTIYKDFKLFKYTAMYEYFNKANLYRVILRYIAYKEHIIDRHYYLKLDKK
jgi:hypothetical protein